MHEPLQDDELAAFQAALLELTSSALSPDDILGHLSRDVRAAAFRAYVAGFDLHCLEATAVLMRHWGRRGLPVLTRAGDRVGDGVVGRDGETA